MNNEGRTYPIVSICCMAFNHAPFIRKCLDGFLMQEPPTGVDKDEIWYEILIHDDCSTDGTDAIIREYTEKYPDKIFPLYETENQYRKGKVIDAYNYDRAKGRYIAVCEGDDYWTDPKKLQKQVDWMDAHPEYSVCFHRVKHYNAYTGEYQNDACERLLDGKDGVDITNDIFFKGWYTQPLSTIFRTSMYDFSLPHVYRHYRDMHETYHLLQKGKGWLMSFFGGVRIKHQGGVASMISEQQLFDNTYELATEIFNANKDQYTRGYYITTLQWIIDKNQYIPKTKKIGYAYKVYKIDYNLRKLAKNILHILTLKKRIKR